MKKLVLVTIATLLVSTLLPISQCSTKPAAARREDVPYIKCQVCEKIASELHSQVQKKQAEIAPKKISEFQIIEIAENVCNLKKHEADWMLRIDLVEEGDRLELVEQEDRLELVEQDDEGHCNTECKTIERACQEVMGYHDTDVAEYVYSSKPQIDALTNYLCKDLSGACSTKPPSLPKDRIPGEPFVPKSSKEAEMEKIMKSMEGMPGAPSMKMYSREDLMNQNFGADGEEDDEDSDDEKPFPSKLGSILREKEAKGIDWKEKITKKIVSSGQTVKKHVNKVSNQIQKWWKGKSTGSKKSKNSKTEL